MSKYELSISAAYVPTRGVVEGAREFFQNALDEQVADPENKMFFEYDEDEGILRIGNKLSTLDIQTLLFGKSSKPENSVMIGRFGEGYKIATIVFLRNGKEVTFYNYCSREIWHTRLVKSRRYQGALVPTFFVDKVKIWDKVPENSLIIEIKGITPEEYESIRESNLWLQGFYDGTHESEYHDTSYGKILLKDEYKHKLFVSGLFVCEHEDLKYGYDVHPDQIKLDRDRGLVSDIDLAFLTSRMWTSYSLGKPAAVDADTLSVVEAFDGKYMHYSASSDLKSQVANDFIKENGPKAVPVSTQEEADQMTKLDLKPVYVTENKKNLITTSEEFQSNQTGYKIKTLWDRLKDLADSVDDRLTEDERSEFEYILEKSRWILN